MSKLRAAAGSGDINLLYTVIKEDPQILESVDSTPFDETPLHIAASLGHLQFAAEIMDLKPSLALKRNLQGLTPIHLALQNNHNIVALRLVDINKDLVRAKMRGGVTALHMASQSGDVDLLTRFLKECPDSIEDVTIASETALHLAVKHQKFDALKCLVKWLVKKPPDLETAILNRGDEDGNTILHIAALNNDTQAIELLLKHTKYTICLDAKNLLDQTASDLAGNPDIKRKLVKATATDTITKIGKLGSSLIKFMVWWLVGLSRFSGPVSEENRNAYLVVATLVATATYQAALSPPGGLHQIDAPTNNSTLTHSPSNSTILEGKSVLSNNNFISFSAANMSAFLASTLTIISLLPRDAASLLLYMAMCLLVFSYYVSMTVISPNDLTTTNLKQISIAAGVIFTAAAVVQNFSTYSTDYASIFLKKRVHK